MTVFDDLGAEQERLEKILAGLDEAQWLSASGAAGWTIADVVLHLAQSEEAVEATATHQRPRGGLGAVAGGTMDERAAEAVRLERAAPAEVFARWQRARQAGLAAIRAADPDQPLAWVAGPVKPPRWRPRGCPSTGRTAWTSPDRSASRFPTPNGCGISPGWPPHAAVRAEPGREAPVGCGASRPRRTASARGQWCEEQRCG